MYKKGWIPKAAAILNEGGMPALWARATRRLTAPFVGYWYTDHYWEGRIVEWMGNRVHLDGTIISLNHSAISTKDKASFLKHTYESGERRLADRYFPPNEPLIELGSSIGVLACIMNQRLEDPTRHIAVEANPQLITLLENNRSLNGSLFQIVNAAISYDGATATFYLQDKFIAGNVMQKSRQPVTVRACSLESIAESACFEHFNLICDIEGAEVQLLEHEGHYLQQHVGWLLLEQHPSIVGPDHIKWMNKQLLELGFKVIESRHHAICYRNTCLAPVPPIGVPQG